MTEARNLVQLLEDTESALERFDKLSAEKPNDPVIVFNLKAIQKRKADLERRLLELRSTELNEQKIATRIPSFAFDTDGRLEASARLNAPIEDSARELHGSLRSLSKVLLELLNRNAEMLSQSNLPYNALRELAAAYDKVVSADIEDIRIALLFARGQSLFTIAALIENESVASSKSQIWFLIRRMAEVHNLFLQDTYEGAELLRRLESTRDLARLQSSMDELSKVLSSVREEVETIHYTTAEYGRERKSARFLVEGIATHAVGSVAISSISFFLSALVTGSVGLGLIGGALGIGAAAWVGGASNWFKQSTKDEKRSP